MISQQSRLLKTEKVMALVDSWGITAEQKIFLLGLPDNLRTRKLEKFRQSEPFPDIESVNQHVSHLLGISDALRTTYPRNSEMGGIWMKQKHKRFNNNPPLAVMLEKGLKGIIQVRAFLDCTFAWDSSGSV